MMIMNFKKIGIQVRSLTLVLRICINLLILQTEGILGGNTKKLWKGKIVGLGGNVAAKINFTKYR